MNLNKTKPKTESGSLQDELSRERQLRRQLETELDDLKAQLNRSIEEGRMASMATLVSGVAHEANTPIGVSITSCSQLTKNTEQIADQFANATLTSSDLEAYLAKAQRCEELLNKNLHRLALLIETFKKLSGGKRLFSFAEVNLSAEISLILTHLQKQHAECQFNFTVEESEPVTTFTSINCWSEVLQQIVENSVEHGFRPERDNQIDVFIHYGDGDFTTIIRDNGLGMETKVCDEIFTPFFTTSQYQDNIGLGMHLVYTYITQVLKGSISLTSTLGKGCEYIIIVPQQQS